VVEGGLDPEAHYVVDFSELKQLMKRLTDELDHKVCCRCRTEAAGGRKGETVTVAVNGKPRYVFPKIDCALLPIPNTTVEMLAQYLAGRVCRELTTAPGVDLMAIEVEVEENFGQAATYREALGDPRAAWSAASHGVEVMFAQPAVVQGGGYQRPVAPASARRSRSRSAPTPPPARAPRRMGASDLGHEVKVRAAPRPYARQSSTSSAGTPQRQPRVSARAASHDGAPRTGRPASLHASRGRTRRVRSRSPGRSLAGRRSSQRLQADTRRAAPCATTALAATGSATPPSTSNGPATAARDSSSACCGRPP